MPTLAGAEGSRIFSKDFKHLAFLCGYDAFDVFHDVAKIPGISSFVPDAPFRFVIPSLEHSYIFHHTSNNLPSIINLSKTHSINQSINQSIKMESSTTPRLDSASVDQATLNQAFLKQTAAQEAAHLDHSVLNHQPAPTGDIPQLNVNSTSDIKAKNSASSTSANSSTSPTATGVRQRVNNIGSQLEHAGEHPAVKNAKDVAGKQVNQFREFLGNFPAVKELEKRFNVDRVVLVVGGLFA